MRTVLALSAVLLSVAGCSHRAAQNNKADIEKAIQEHLNRRPGLASAAMVLEVKEVAFQGDRAEAEVVVRSKANPEARMALRYVLKRTGTSPWAVEGGKPSGVGRPHGTSPPEMAPESVPAHPPLAGQAQK